MAFANFNLIFYGLAGVKDTYIGQFQPRQNFLVLLINDVGCFFRWQGRKNWLIHDDPIKCGPCEIEKNHYLNKTSRCSKILSATPYGGGRQEEGSLKGSLRLQLADTSIWASWVFVLIQYSSDVLKNVNHSSIQFSNEFAFFFNSASKELLWI